MCIRDRNITVGLTGNVINYIDETLHKIVVNITVGIKTTKIIIGNAREQNAYELVKNAFVKSSYAERMRELWNATVTREREGG